MGELRLLLTSIGWQQQLLALMKQADSILYVITDRCHRSKAPEMWQCIVSA
ncbi:hypothetical protein [Muribaculum intestinale]|jgi:hypothetical protein|uniref:hypothetical protein n=1 Tax=Muribaculum intestinale TaxID=1796646 RepID=UPI0025AE9393|nr:hypothetical protein [Muribaculum intestinale]